jgi:hypothetical protein
LPRAGPCRSNERVDLGQEFRHHVSGKSELAERSDPAENRGGWKPRGHESVEVVKRRYPPVGIPSARSGLLRRLPACRGSGDNVALLPLVTVKNVFHDLEAVGLIAEAWQQSGGAYPRLCPVPAQVDAKKLHIVARLLIAQRHPVFCEVLTTSRAFPQSMSMRNVRQQKDLGHCNGSCVLLASGRVIHD